MKKVLSRVALLLPFTVVPLESRMLSRIFGAILVGISMLAIPTPVSANHVPAVIPNQGEPELDTPIKKIPRPIIGALRAPLRELPQIENFQIIGHDVIPNPNDIRPRGRNGGIGIQDDCLYVANRLTRRSGTGAHFGNTELPPEIAIIDIADPKQLRTVGHFSTILGSNNREIRTIPDRNTLIVLNVGTVDNLAIYDVTNCRTPVLTKTIDFGADEGHEFFVWRDPQNLRRFVIYVSHSGVEPGLRAYEVMSPPNGSVNNVPVATFTLAPAVPRNEPTDPDRYRDDHFVFTTKPTSQTNSLHSMSVSENGKRVYMANSQAGYFILDSSRLAAGLPCIPNTVTVDETTNLNPNLCLRKINPDPGARYDQTPPFGGIHHSIYPVPGRPGPFGNPQYAVTGGERNGTVTCPWTPGQILDVTDEMNPTVVSRYMVPENLGENCFVGGPGDPALFREFSTHQPLLFPNLFFLTWYSAGFRAWDIANPSLPLEVGVFVPRPETNVVEYFRDSPDVWMWPFPILHNGLIYVTDENSGLYVLRYTGRRAKELPQRGTFLSNITNIR